MVEVAEFGEKYRQSVQKFSKENFEDRANLSYFTWYMVAIVNNCSIFGEQVIVPFLGRFAFKFQPTYLILTLVSRELTSNQLQVTTGLADTVLAETTVLADILSEKRPF